MVAGGRAKEMAEWHKQGKEGNKRPYRLCSMAHGIFCV